MRLWKRREGSGKRPAPPLDPIPSRPVLTPHEHATKRPRTSPKRETR